MKNTFQIDYSTYIFYIFSLLSGYIKDITIILLIIIIHEFGHYFLFKINKVEITKMTIYPFGGICKINKKIHSNQNVEITCALGGIIFQIILLFISILLHKYNLLLDSTYSLLIKYNKAIIIFNLLPIIPLDGSKILASIYNKIFPYKLSYILTFITSIIIFIFFIAFNYNQNNTDLSIYVLLLIQNIEYIKLYKYILNKFYLERIIYENKYNKIKNNATNLNFKLDTYYYFKEDNKYINEKNYLLNKKYRRNKK